MFIQGLTEDHRQGDRPSVALRNLSEKIEEEASLHMILGREYVQSSIHLSKSLVTKTSISVFFYIWKNARMWLHKHFLQRYIYLKVCVSKAQSALPCFLRPEFLSEFSIGQ